MGFFPVLSTMHCFDDWSLENFHYLHSYGINNIIHSDNVFNCLILWYTCTCTSTDGHILLIFCDCSKANFLFVTAYPVLPQDGGEPRWKPNSRPIELTWPVWLRMTYFYIISFTKNSDYWKSKYCSMFNHHRPRKIYLSETKVESISISVCQYRYYRSVWSISSSELLHFH